MSTLYRIFIRERKVFLLFSCGVLAYGLFLFNKYLSVQEYSHFWWKCWLISIAFLIIAFSDISPSSFLSIHKKGARFLKEFFHLHFQKTGYLAAFLLIIALCIFFRLYRLDYFPWGLEGLNVDTACAAEYALKILGGIPFTPVGKGIIFTHETLPYYYIALFFSLFGPSLFVLRCAALSAGVANIVLTYFVIKSITNNIIVSLAGTALLAFSAVDTVLNYSGYECVVSTPILLANFLLVNLAIKNTKSIYFIVAGLCFGLGLSTSKYFISLAPGVVLMFIYYAGFNLQCVKSIAKGMAFFFLAALYVVLPEIIYLMYHHTEYFVRWRDVITQETTFKDRGIINTLGEFYSGIKLTFTMMFFRATMVYKWFIGDTPIIDRLTAPLFFIGIIYAIIKIKNVKYFFLLCYLALLFFLNAVSYPGDYRFIIFMPLLYIMASLALNLINYVSKFKRLLYIPVGIYLLLIILFNIKIYYTGMGVNLTKSLYRVENIILGKYLSENPPDKKTYVSLGHAGVEMDFFNYFNRARVDFSKLIYGVPWRWEGQKCNDDWYNRILANLCAIIDESKHKQESLFLIFDNAPCHEEVVSILESVFKKGRSALSIYSKSCKSNLTYFTFELKENELMQKDLIKSIIPSNPSEADEQ